ncbi:hypothetical protein BD779DRAFT_97141 [Infundibulicybe gibba]|nr:hypothetical protein BD779DRAFT_97141 [Infundibulicybe gibba]
MKNTSCWTWRKSHRKNNVTWVHVGKTRSRCKPCANGFRLCVIQEYPTYPKQTANRPQDESPTVLRTVLQLSLGHVWSRPRTDVTRCWCRLLGLYSLHCKYIIQVVFVQKSSTTLRTLFTTGRVILYYYELQSRGWQCSLSDFLPVLRDLQGFR